MERVPDTVCNEQEIASAQALLGGLLERSSSVSSLGLRRQLELKGFQNARDLVLALRLKTADAEGQEDGSPSYFHRGKSFYTKQGLLELEQAEAAEAQRAEDLEAQQVPVIEDETPLRRNRKEEARLVTYVHSALEEIYVGDHAPERIEEFVFDVHNERCGGVFENVDLLAIDWRSLKRVELVTVEAKLDFTAQLVHQAHNYTRFSHRVWLAVRVHALPQSAAGALRLSDPRLFDYCIDQGLGILACRPSRGRSYEVFPVHWPRRLSPDPAELEAFMERYRSCLEVAGVLAPVHQAHRPAAL